MDKLKMETPDLAQVNIEKLAVLFPACVTEARDEDGKLKKAVNFELLRQMLSDVVLEGDEAYEFTWVGKKAAIVEANRPIRKTLRPCPEESVDWDSTENLYIEGDNLEVLKLLQESYLGKVKMIYIDPPYNTGNDFIYRDDFSMSGEEYSEESGQVDEETGDRLFKNTDSNGRFHSDWCSMIYSRLMLARNMLTEDGVIFISIDDNEQGNLKEICDEVFGAENFVSEQIWEKKFAPQNDDKYITHAVMQLNAEDGGHRKFIMAQLPEACDEKSEAYKAGYSNICEIGKERIRRAAQKIAADNPDKPFDGGFRVFKLDDTNMTDVYYSAGEYSQDMLSLLESNIKPDRTDLDLLFGCLLEWGLPLSMPYTSEKIDGCTVHTYNDGDLIACFDENIPDTVIKEIAKRQPLRAVFLDSSFANSPAKINVGEIFKMLAPDTRVKVL